MNAAWGQEPGRVSFFQAVRHLLRTRTRGADQTVAEDPELEPGTAALRVHPSLQFPAAEVHQIRAEDDSRPPEVSVSFLGVIGTLGILPAHYSSLLIRRVRERDTSLRDFLDLFHHRILTLYYRAWAKYRLAVQLEQTVRGEPGSDLVTGQLMCLLGLGTDHLRKRLPLDGRLLLFHGGHFARHVRPASSLQQILMSCLGVPIAVQEFQSSWLDLSLEDRSRLTGRPGSGHCVLGVDMVLGERVWDCQSSFRLRVGPLPWAGFREFLPGRPRRALLQALTRQFVGGALRFELQLLLEGNQVPPCRPGSSEEPPLLGWCTWLGGRDPTRLAEDAILPGDLDVASESVS